MLLSSPLPRAHQPGFHEGSALRSTRDADATSRQWIKNETTTGQTWVIMRALSKLHREVDKLRRRVIGGGASQPASTGMRFRNEWSPAPSDGPYIAQDIVFFTPDGGASGAYIAMTNVPDGISPDTGLPNWVAWPTPPPGNWG